MPFILAVAAFAWQIEPFLQDFSLIFSLSFNILSQLIMLVGTIALIAYLFTVFAVLASDWTLVLPVIVLSSLSTLLFVTAPISYFLSIGLLIAFVISFAQTYNKVIKDPSGFHVSENVVKPSGSLATLIILATSVAFYFSVSATGDKITQKIVDSVVNISGDIMKTQQLPQNTGTNPLDSISISSDQIKLLKENPDLLKQSGLDPAILDTIGKQDNKNVTAQDLAVEAAKPLITKQVTDMIKPITPILPFLMVFLFYLNFQFLASTAAFILSPSIYLLFWILEKTGFIHFEIEMRAAKKLVV